MGSSYEEMGKQCDKMLDEMQKEQEQRYAQLQKDIGHGLAVAAYSADFNRVGATTGPKAAEFEKNMTPQITDELVMSVKNTGTDKTSGLMQPQFFLHSERLGDNQPVNLNSQTGGKVELRHTHQDVGGVKLVEKDVIEFPPAKYGQPITQGTDTVTFLRVQNGKEEELAKMKYQVKFNQTWKVGQ